MAAGVFLYPGFSEYELSVALSVLKQGRHRTVTIGLSRNPVVGESGLTCIPDTTLADIDLADIDSLVLPGSEDMGHLKDESHLFYFISECAKRNKVIAAISGAPFLLAKAGVLETHRYTVAFTREQRDFIGVFNEENYVDAPLVVDKQVLTAKGAYFVDFGIRLGRMLNLTFDPTWYR